MLELYHTHHRTNRLTQHPPDDLHIKMTSKGVDELSSLHPATPQTKPAIDHFYTLQSPRNFNDQTDANFFTSLPNHQPRQDPTQVIPIFSFPTPLSSSAIHLSIFLSPITLPTSTQPSSSPSSSASSSSSDVPTSSISGGTEDSIITSQLPKVRIATFIPAFIAGGIFLLALLSFAIWRCCKRKSKKRRLTVVGLGYQHDSPNFWNRNAGAGELVCGPKYVGKESEGGGYAYHDSSMDEEEAQKFDYYHNCEAMQATQSTTASVSSAAKAYEQRCSLGHGQPPRQREYCDEVPHFGWPSLSQPPTFDPQWGFHVPPSTSDDPLLTPIELVAHQDDRPTRTKGSVVRPVPLSSQRQVASPPPTMSNATSAAFQELYEDMNNDGGLSRSTTRHAKRNAIDMTTPWETLRHKSIKRGILEKVEQEEKNRARFSEGVRRASGAIEADSGDGKRRRKHFKQPSDVIIAGNSTNSRYGQEDEEDSDATPKVGQFHKLEVRNPSMGVGRLGTISGATTPSESIMLEDGSFPQSTPKHPRLRSASSRPQPVHGQRIGELRSKTTSPLRPAYKTAADVVSKDVLSPHPTQIMSPPLQSHILFLPPPSFYDAAAQTFPAAPNNPTLRPKANH